MKFVQFEQLEARDVPAVAFVTNGNVDGAGSFRAAVEAANADSSITSIVIRRQVDSIAIESAVEYTGSQTLSIQGNGVVIAPTAGDEQEFDLFVASGGADLFLRDLTLRGGEDGLFVTVPADASAVSVNTCLVAASPVVSTLSMPPSVDRVSVSVRCAVSSTAPTLRKRSKPSPLAPIV